MAIPSNFIFLQFVISSLFFHNQICLCQEEAVNFNSSLNQFSPIFLAPSVAGNVNCANGGRFLGEYCLGDYNCDQGRPGSKRVCIRGLCCSKTRTSKAASNRRRPEDGICLGRRSFNVGLQCTRDEDCLRHAKMLFTTRFPLPILECLPSARQCCTSSQYQIPLAKGAWCLNGGRALGRMNGFRQCVTNVDCRNAQRPRAVCVDRQCCTPPIRKGNGGLEDEDEGGIDEFGDNLEGDWDDLDGFGWENNANNDEDNFDMDDGGLNGRDEQLRQGRQICRRLGLPYLQVRRCSRRLSCGDPRRFQCISTHCCLRRLPPTAGLDDDAGFFDEDDNFAEENGWTENGNNGGMPMITNGNGGGGIPAIGSYCVGTGRFRRFLGQFCTTRADCTRALDARRRPVPIRCLRGACCAALRRRGQQSGAGNDDPGAGRNDGILPVRPAGAFAFCFDGTLSRRQCSSSLDCPFPRRQNCVNNICCAPSIDQTKYACGGLASAGQCTASTRASTNAGCRDNLHCVGPGACCECQFGQPQAGISDCRKRQAMCLRGYSCDASSGFCCPQCPDGAMPFGSCYLGKCARGFQCRPGNICCQMRRQNGNGNDLDWGETADLLDDGFEFEEGRNGGNGRRGRLAGIGTNWRGANAFWGDESSSRVNDNWDDDEEDGKEEEEDYF